MPREIREEKNKKRFKKMMKDYLQKNQDEDEKEK